MKTSYFFGLMAFAFTLFVGAPEAKAQATGSFPVLNSVAEEATDPGTMNDRQWKSLRKELTSALTSDDEAVREQGLKNLIFFATYFGDRADFQRAADELYDIYKLDGNEAHRIMALVALDAIGEENTMAQVAQSVRLEKSDRVRHLTYAALAN